MHITVCAFAILAFASSTSHAQPRSELKKAYLCQIKNGPVVLVERQELKEVRGAICRAIEYRVSAWSVVKRCLQTDGTAVFINGESFETQAGCREIEEPLR